MDIVWVDPLGEIEAGSENMDDPSCVSIQRYVRGTKAYVTVGHLPREVSRHIYHFLDLGGWTEIGVQEPKAKAAQESRWAKGTRDPFRG